MGLHNQGRLSQLPDSHLGVTTVLALDFPTWMVKSLFSSSHSATSSILLSHCDYRVTTPPGVDNAL